MKDQTNMDGAQACGLGMGQVRIIATHFLIAAVWADAEEGTHPRVTKQARAAAEEWAKAFLCMADPADIKACAEAPGYGAHPDAGSPWAAIGHDLWLTCNGHGVGFWDRDELPEDVGQRLTEVCRKMGDPGQGFECYRGWAYLRVPEVYA
jgi:hypothetical protein